MQRSGPKSKNSKTRPATRVSRCPHGMPTNELCRGCSKGSNVKFNHYFGTLLDRISARKA